MKKIFLLTIILGSLLFTAQGYTSQQNRQHIPDKESQQWVPVEWNLRNFSWEGNPFDIVAKVIFSHENSNEIRTTEMFYDSGNTWRFRFTGTRPGRWYYRTVSDDSDLNGKTGSVKVIPNPKNKGFVIGYGNRWARQGTGKVFTPQYVMYYGPKYFYKKPKKVDKDIRTFLIDHGFKGFHVPVLCSWFELEKTESTEIRIPNPDIRTFEALEMLIEKVYAAGGSIHIWVWGDEQRKMTPIKWGINGREDRRLQRYIAARLGPIPGWTMGYGFDLEEWVTDAEVNAWAKNMSKHFGWNHLLGGRGMFSESLSYSSYDQKKPSYEIYSWSIDNSPIKPSFSEDRFRVRKKFPKDYTFDETRQGLWRSTMAGGVANIWGNVLGKRSCRDISNCASNPYPNKDQIKTYFRFFENRFYHDMIRDNSITDGVCLRRVNKSSYIFYKEDTSSISMDFSNNEFIKKAVAVDTKKKYNEIELENLLKTKLLWLAPHRSDWAIFFFMHE